MSHITILTITEAVRLDDLGNLKRTRLVRYKVGEHGPFQLEVPEEQFTADHVRERLERAAAEIVRLTSF